MGCVRPVLRLPEVPDVPDLSLFPPSAAIAGDDLHVGGCSLREMAERFGTPAYVIDEQALRTRARDYQTAFTRRHPRSRRLI
jgi:diaminopimelate decarboxylase